MKSKKEIMDWILENCTERDGDVNLLGLDFGDRNVRISGMKARKIYQRFHQAKVIYQGAHKAEKVEEGRHTILEPKSTVFFEVTKEQHETIKKLLEVDE